MKRKKWEAKILVVELSKMLGGDSKSDTKRISSDDFLKTMGASVS